MSFINSLNTVPMGSFEGGEEFSDWTFHNTIANPCDVLVGEEWVENPHSAYVRMRVFSFVECTFEGDPDTSIIDVPEIAFPAFECNGDMWEYKDGWYYYYYPYSLEPGGATTELTTHFNGSDSWCTDAEAFIEKINTQEIGWGEAILYVYFVYEVVKDFGTTPDWTGNDMDWGNEVNPPEAFTPEYCKAIGREAIAPDVSKPCFFHGIIKNVLYCWGPGDWDWTQDEDILVDEETPLYLSDFKSIFALKDKWWDRNYKYLDATNHWSDPLETNYKYLSATREWLAPDEVHLFLAADNTWRGMRLNTEPDYSYLPQAMQDWIKTLEIHDSNSDMLSVRLDEEYDYNDRKVLRASLKLDDSFKNTGHKYYAKMRACSWLETDNPDKYSPADAITIWYEDDTSQWLLQEDGYYYYSNSEDYYYCLDMEKPTAEIQIRIGADWPTEQVKFIAKVALIFEVCIAGGNDEEGYWGEWEPSPLRNYYFAIPEYFEAGGWEIEDADGQYPIKDIYNFCICEVESFEWSYEDQAFKWTREPFNGKKGFRYGLPTISWQSFSNEDEG